MTSCMSSLIRRIVYYWPYVAFMLLLMLALYSILRQQAVFRSVGVCRVDLATLLQGYYLGTANFADGKVANDSPVRLLKPGRIAGILY